VISHHKSSRSSPPLRSPRAPDAFHQRDFFLKTFLWEDFGLLQVFLYWSSSPS
jgi:hypothetical protein